LLGTFGICSHEIYPGAVCNTSDEDARKFLCLTRLYSIFLSANDLRAVFVSLAGVRDFEFEFTEAEKHDFDLQFERVLRELKKRADAGKGSRPD
jgi:hypothetical protein